MGWDGHVARMGDRRVAFRVFVVRPEGKKSVGRSRRRWEDNIKMVLQHVGLGGGARNGFIWLWVTTGGRRL